jgi:hypothetical protein
MGVDNRVLFVGRKKKERKKEISFINTFYDKQTNQFLKLMLNRLFSHWKSRFFFSFSMAH